MAIDVDRLSSQLAGDPAITDYDFWRALRLIEDRLYEMRRQDLPVSLKLLHARKVIRAAQDKRRRLTVAERP